MLSYNLLDGIQKLVPGAKFKSRFVNNNEIEYGTMQWLDIRDKPSFIDVDQATLQSLRRDIRTEINLKTDNIIKYFEYSDSIVYLNLEFQFNLSQLVVMKDYLTYPYTMKVHDDTNGGGVYMTMDTSDDLIALYHAGFNHVSQVLSDGRILKDQLNEMGRTELEEFQDLRVVNFIDT